MLDLAGGDGNGRSDSRTTDLATVEGIAPRCCFRMDALEVGTDCGTRRDLTAKTLELRVISIAASISAQHCSSQQRFSPQCDKAFGIEVPRMQRPEPHLRGLRCLVNGRLIFPVRFT
jgi:hypothetical protein